MLKNVIIILSMQCNISCKFYCLKSCKNCVICSNSFKCKFFLNHTLNSSIPRSKQLNATYKHSKTSGHNNSRQCYRRVCNSTAAVCSEVKHATSQVLGSMEKSLDRGRAGQRLRCTEHIITSSTGKQVNQNDNEAQM